MIRKNTSSRFIPSGGQDRRVIDRCGPARAWLVLPRPAIPHGTFAHNLVKIANLTG